MANHPSAAKRIRQTQTRTSRNRHIRATVRGYVKRVRKALTEGNSQAAQSALSLASQQIDRAVSKGVYHRRTGSRYIARLAQQVNALLKPSAE